MLKFDGEALLVDHRLDAEKLHKDVQNWPLYARIPYLNERASGQVQGIDPCTAWPAPPYPLLPDEQIRPNTLYWPTGATRWAFMFVYATSAAAERIVNRLHSPQGEKEGLLEITDGTSTFTAEMSMLTPVRVSGTAGGPDRNADGDLYVLPLVDARYHWQEHPVDLSLITSDPVEWSDVFGAIGTAIGTQIDVDAIPGEYLRPDPREFGRPWPSAAEMLEAAAGSVGLRVVRDPDGVVIAMGSARSQQRQNGSAGAGPDTLVAGYPGFFTPAPTVETVRTTVRDVDKWCDEPCAAESYTEDAPQGRPTVQGLTHVVRSTCWLDTTEDPPPNEAKCEALAKQIGEDYYEWAKWGGDVTYRGVRNWLLNGYTDVQVITYAAPGHTTRIVCFADLFAVRDNLSQDTDVDRPDCCCLSLLFAFENVVPGGEGLAELMEWNEANDQYEPDGNGPVHRIADRTWSNCVLKNEAVWCVESKEEAEPGEKAQWDIVGENGTRRRAKATQDMACGGGGELLVDIWGGAFPTPDPNECDNNETKTLVISACTEWAVQTRIDSDDELYVQWLRNSRRWYVEPLDKCTTATATIQTGVMCSLDEFIPINNWGPNDRCCNIPVPSLVWNRFKLMGKLGQLLYLRRDVNQPKGDDREWYIVQVEHTIGNLVGEMNFGDCKFQYSELEFAMMTCGTASNQEVPGNKIEMIGAIEIVDTSDDSTPGCGLQITYDELCVFGGIDPESSTQIIPFAKITPVVDVADQSDGLYQTLGEIWGLCAGTGPTDKVVEYADCPPPLDGGFVPEA